MGSPQATSPVLAMRRVRFLPCVLVRETLHCANYTKEEVRATWYQPADYAQMRARNIALVRKLQSGHGVEKYCTRGLESMAGQAHLQRVVRRAQLYAQVAECQAAPHQQEHVEDALQSISIHISLPACVEAQERALRDAIVVKCIWKVRSTTKPTVKQEPSMSPTVSTAASLA